MKGHSLLTVAIFIALLVVCGLCIITIYGTYTWLETSGTRWEWIICAVSSMA
jgi:hypothetical protein